MKRMNFPGRKKTRHEEAIERNEAWAKLSPQQQLQELDKRFGKDQGASRQRKRLSKLL